MARLEDFINNELEAVLKQGDDPTEVFRVRSNCGDRRFGNSPWYRSVYSLTLPYLPYTLVLCEPLNEDALSVAYVQYRRSLCISCCVRYFFFRSILRAIKNKSFYPSGARGDLWFIRGNIFGTDSGGGYKQRYSAVRKTLSNEQYSVFCTQILAEW